jgi:4a-hydroxytetrahydrobiopterin dehydratase
MWQEIDNQMYRRFQFQDFSTAFVFLTQIAMLSEKFNHHPTIKLEWNILELWLSTHSAGKIITEKDRHLAKAIDQLSVT